MLSVVFSFILFFVFPLLSVKDYDDDFWRERERERERERWWWLMRVFNTLHSPSSSYVVVDVLKVARLCARACVLCISVERVEIYGERGL